MSEATLDESSSEPNKGVLEVVESVTGNYVNETAVPCNEDWAVFEVKLWSILSAAATVNSPGFKTGGEEANQIVIPILSTDCICRLGCNVNHLVIGNAQAQFMASIYKFFYGLLNATSDQCKWVRLYPYQLDDGPPWTLAVHQLQHFYASA